MSDLVNGMHGAGQLLAGLQALPPGWVLHAETQLLTTLPLKVTRNNTTMSSQKPKTVARTGQVRKDWITRSPTF
ncbi:hypothetical protein ABBQ38_001086 [Trebouxia sp. C0009 RCD-2024]